MSVRPSAAVTVTLLVAAVAGGAFAAPPADQAPHDRILPIQEHRTDKARRLAVSYAQEMRQLNNEIYHCMPWLEVRKDGLGFYKPRHVTEDARYLSLWVYIDQDPSPAFTRLSVEDRVSAMFSRYVPPLLRRMARSLGLRSESTLQGFNINLDWLKEIPRSSSERPIHESIHVFLDRPEAAQFLEGRSNVRELATRAHVRRSEGATPLGPLHLGSAWEDDFVSTFAVKNYQPPAGVGCR